MVGFVKFNKGILKMAWPIKTWLGVLVFFNGIAPLLLLQHLEALMVLGAMMCGAMLMALLTARFGFTRILGLGHILWIPLVGWLALRLGQIPPTDFLGLWVRGVILVNTLSLIMDAVDVVRYVRGEREEMVTGLSLD